jgi:membrane protease YdiL (CAAX protease family)
VPPVTPAPPSSARAVGSLLFYTAVVVVLGAGLGVAVVSWVQPESDRTTVRLVRRVMMLLAALLLPLLLKALDFRPATDWGWRTKAPRRAGRDFLAGLALGLGSLGALAGLALVMGTRGWEPAYAPGALVGKLVGYAFSAAAVGVLEETFARAVLFFPLWRALGAPAAALLSGLIFAWAHFLLPEAAALRPPSLVDAWWATLRSALGHLAVEEAGAVRFFHLVLMSLVLCAAVVRTGSIWLAAGLHAGWVWVKKTNAVLAQSQDDHPLVHWLGARSDLLDGLACGVVLLAVGWGLRRGKRVSPPG